MLRLSLFALLGLATLSAAGIATTAPDIGRKILQSIGGDSDKILVAFVITHHANVIDMTGPWEVFQDVVVDGNSPFRLYTVSDNREPVEMTAGLKVVPDYSLDDAPAPDIIVVGAQAGSRKMIKWLQTQTETNDITMSVCTGAFQLAKAGLLDGLKATTHHDFFDSLEKSYPEVDVQRGHRFIEGSERIATQAA